MFGRLAQVCTFIPVRVLEENRDGNILWSNILRCVTSFYALEYLFNDAKMFFYVAFV